MKRTRPVVICEPFTLDDEQAGALIDAAVLHEDERDEREPEAREGRGGAR